MPKINFLVTALTALIPLLTGFIWYSKVLFGNAWLKSTGLSEDDLKNANMAKVFILTYIFGVMIAFGMHFITIHQFGVYSTLKSPELDVAGSDLNTYFIDFMNKYGHNYRSFKHGALHGALIAPLFIMPIISILALFERKGFKYIAIHTGYWMLTLALMGGVICQWSW